MRIPRGTDLSFRVDSETATLLNSYTPVGFERTIMELGERAWTRTLPPSDRPAIPGGMDKAMAVFREIGMHLVQEPDAIREGRGLLIDLGNWRGPHKYEELARIASFAETYHAKCHFMGAEPDIEDFRRSLQILKDSGYSGPLALVYDGADDDEWAKLELEDAICRNVFG